MISGGFVDVAGESARRHVWATSGLQWASITIVPAGEIAINVVRVKRAGGLQGFTGRADAKIALWIIYLDHI